MNSSDMTSDTKWCDCGIEHMASLYGPNWRSLPRVYGSLGMAGDDRLQRFDEHEEIARELYPHFLFVSPYRGIGKQAALSPDVYMRDGLKLNARHAYYRDYADVRAARVVLLNMQAPPRLMDILKPPHSDDLVILPHARPADEQGVYSGYTKLGSVFVDAPLTGTIAEVIEAGRQGIPVVGYNANCASTQMANPFVREHLTMTFDFWQDAVKYIKSDWY